MVTLSGIIRRVFPGCLFAGAPQPAGGGGEVLKSCMAVAVCPSTLACFQCRDGTRQVFTDQGNIACPKLEAPCGVTVVAFGGEPNEVS